MVAPLPAHPDLVHDPHRPSAASVIEALPAEIASRRLDLGLRQRLAREVKQAEHAPHRAGEAPELGDAPAGVNRQIAGLRQLASAAMPEVGPSEGPAS